MRSTLTLASTTLVIVLMLTLPLLAQGPTIDASAFRDLGRNTIHHSFTIDSAMIGPGGTDRVWDFRVASVGAIDSSGNYVDASSLEFSSVFHGSNYALVKTQSGQLSQTYCQLDSSSFRVLGIVNAISKSTNGTTNGFITTMQPADVVYPFPMYYGKSDSGECDEYAGNRATLHFSRGTSTDGYGSIFLPDGQRVDNVIRVRSYSSYTEQTSNGTIHFEQVHYTFFQQEYPAGPICDINNTYGMANSTQTFQGTFSTDLANDVEDAGSASSFTVSPQPAAEELHIQAASNEHILSVDLYDALGRAVLHQDGLNSSIITLSLPNLSTGFYRCVLRNEHGSTARTVMVAR